MDLNKIETVLAVLNGAAFTIQSIWRQYAQKSKTKTTASNYSTFVLKGFRSANNQKEFSTNHTQTCIANGFVCDVIIEVEGGRSHYCHSLVLSLSSDYFHDYFKSLTTSLTPTNFMKFELSVSEPCWLVVQNYMYGHDVEIHLDIVDELRRVASELRIKQLLAQLNRQGYYDAEEEINNSPRSNLSSTSPIKSPIYPLVMTSNFYKFFKCVVYFCSRRKLKPDTAYSYLAPDFIDYSRMSRSQLRKCLCLLKTKLKLKNSSLILKIIEIYLAKK